MLTILFTLLDNFITCKLDTGKYSTSVDIKVLTYTPLSPTMDSTKTEIWNRPL